MNKTVTPRNTYSATELAEMRLPKLPTTRKSWYERAEREKWEFVEVPGKGPGGLRREFKPSPEVMALIEQRQRGELPPPPEKPVSKPAAPSGIEPQRQVMYMAMEPAPGAANTGARLEINQHLLWLCHDACLQVHGAAFAAERAQVQIDYATDLYNLLVRVSAAKGGEPVAALESFCRLDAEEMGEQLNLFLQMKWVKQYPPPQIPEGAESYSW